MKRQAMCGLLLGLTTLGAGCRDIFGFQDPTPLASGGAGGAGGETDGTGGTGGITTGTGGMACAPGTFRACYDGPAGTEGVASCKAGTQTCNADGSAFEACTDAVLPATEACADTADENCDGWDCVLWAHRYGDANAQTPTDVAVDPAGNVFVAGFFTGTVNFGGDALVSSGKADLFLVKLDPSGKHLWSQRFGDGEDQQSIAIAADPDGNVILAGDFKGTLQLGASQLVSMGDTDIFLGKLDAAGVQVWSNQYGDAQAQAVGDVAVDDEGNVVLAGGFRGEVTFAGSSMNAVGGANASGGDAYIATFDGITGIGKWARRFGDSDAQGFTSVAVGGGGNILVAGVNFSSITLGESPIADLRFIGRFDKDGNHTWSRGVTGGLSFELLLQAPGMSVAADSSGNAFLTAHFDKMMNAGGPDLIPLGGTDIFLAKYDAVGTPMWIVPYGTSADDRDSKVAVDSDGNLLLTATSEGNLNMGGGELPNKGSFDVVMAKLTPDGQHLWSRAFGGAASQELPLIAPAPSGESVVACLFSGSIDFGSGPLLSMDIDVAIAKLAR